ncbi:MAG: glycosyltransferase family 4 protein [Solirubrobacteraceae bacterium]|nr:glycosyltransferase family 4 protein [Solirubrobacteraceae bacterium]
MTDRAQTLGIYVDGPFGVVETPEGRRVATDAADFPFLTFACEVGGHFARTVLFGRAHPDLPRDVPLLLRAGVELAPLPPYDDLSRIGQVARATLGTARGFWRGLATTDVVWVTGPHPFSFLLVALALVRRRRVVLGVRQDTVEYFRSRLPGRHWQPVLLAARGLDAAFRALSRILPTTVVGPEIEHRYGGPRASLLRIAVSLVRDADLVSAPARHPSADRVSLFTVGRIDQEKNPLLLVEAMAALERLRPGRYFLAWAGTGALEGAVRARAAELGVSDRIEFLGFVPFGPELLRRYREADLFVHVSRTEGVPAVLIEAFASGTPVVATDVGGVATAVDGGRAAILVPPADLDALVAAVLRVTEEPELHRRLSARGPELARECTLERQSARIAAFARGGARGTGRP